jgi:pyruvate dehydrogenase E2 component (dihydrolipoamide acetyltransferase)
MDEFIAVDGKAILSKAIEITLSADHRILDGAYAARYLVELKQVLENPVRLLTS